MLINKHNLTIAEHCASESNKSFITNGLQFTKTGTLAINGSYSVSVSALHTSDDEIIGCVALETVKDMKTQATAGDIEIKTASLPFMKGRAPKVEAPDNPVKFEITLNSAFLLTLAKSACDFDEDSILRIQFTGDNDPVRMDARNTKTGQKWEAYLMPRKPGKDAERFAGQPVDDLAAALAEAQKLAGL